VELNLPEVNHEEVDHEEERRKREAVAELEREVPQNKMELWQFAIDWDKLSKSVVLERNIRPWLEEMSNEYMGGVEEKFIALVEKKLLSRSHPDKIIKIMKQLLDDDSEEFVIKLWKKLVLEYLKLQNGLI
jgi:RNA-binding protein 25